MEIELADLMAMCVKNNVKKISKMGDAIEIDFFPSTSTEPISAPVINYPTKENAVNLTVEPVFKDNPNPYR